MLSWPILMNQKGQPPSRINGISQNRSRMERQLGVRAVANVIDLDCNPTSIHRPCPYELMQCAVPNQ